MSNWSLTELILAVYNFRRKTIFSNDIITEITTNSEDGHVYSLISSKHRSLTLKEFWIKDHTCKIVSHT